MKMINTEELRTKWAIFADGIELTYGQESPAAKAFRQCIGDLYDLSPQKIQYVANAEHNSVKDIIHALNTIDSNIDYKYLNTIWYIKTSASLNDLKNLKIFDTVMII